MPVLPEVGSTSTERSGAIRPAASAASIMETPMRSFTDASGLKNSSLPTISARQPASAGRRLKRTSGVEPMVSAMLS